MTRTRIVAAIAAAAAVLALAGCGAAAAAPGPSHSAAASPFKDQNGYRCQRSEVTILDGFSYCPADPAAPPAPSKPAVSEPAAAGNVAACKTAMTRDYDHALASPDAPPATRPAACKGVPDATLNRLVGEIMAGNTATATP